VGKLQFRHSIVTVLYKQEPEIKTQIICFTIFIITDTAKRLQPATWIPPQPSHTETPTHIETRTHDQCDDTIEKSQAPDDGCINVRNMLSIEEVK